MAMAAGVLTPLAQAQGDTIKIVSSLPRTGSSKGQTDTIVNAMKMAFEEANYQAGGFTITYDDMDDATPARGAWDAGKEAENANKAVNDTDVMVYLGTFNSGAAKVAIPVLNRSNLVMISPANTYPGLTKPGKGEPNEPDIYYPNGVRNYARVVPADDLQGAVAANWAKQVGATNVYVLDDTELYGHGIAQVFADTAGKIGLVSKSGTLTYQMMYELRDIGFSTAVGIGGDPIIGTTHIDCLAAFQDDPETAAVVMIGEIGGDAEERAAAFIEQHVTKPVVGYVAGFTAPEGKTMGHAGAIISGSAGTAQAKKEALEKAGVRVGKTPSETAALVREIIKGL